MQLRGRHARGLRQLAHPDEVLRVEAHAPVDQFVADLRPVAAGRPVADVMAHARCARREDRDVAAALPLELELGALQRLADLIVGDVKLTASSREADASLSPSICFLRYASSSFGAVV